VIAVAIVGEEDHAARPEMSRALHAGIDGSALTVIVSVRDLTPREARSVLIAELDKPLAARQ
jgi:3-oxoadipate enol-lactonase